jgi:hypothetical protein
MQCDYCIHCLCRKYPEEYKQQLLKFVLQTLGPSSHDTVAEAAAVVERQAQQ